MYATINFKTKKALKEAVAAGKRVTIWGQGYLFGNNPQNGTVCIEGPHYPQAHSWYATVTLENGVVVKVE